MDLDEATKTTKMEHSEGIFGRVFAFYGVTEAQGRGTEHISYIISPPDLLKMQKAAIIFFKVNGCKNL